MGYYRMLGFGDRDRLKLLESFACAAAPRLHAIIGIDGQQAVAIATGLRHSCRMGRTDPTKRLVVFHSGGKGLPECKSTMARVDQRGRKKRLRHELLDITTFVRTDDTRAGWRHAITHLVASGAEDQFGMVFHLGGVADPSDIGGDFDVLLPMIGDQTLVVMLDTRRDRAPVARRYRAMVEQEGWNGIKIGGLAVL